MLYSDVVMWTTAILDTYARRRRRSDCRE